ncbi:hypothetical protein [Nostoc sp. 'Peltigera membranacea cyanobiont' 213]|uniref:hypothetical protein n=1 Tax=Nostoc sp. 'Peltigera membranacea cyanobiont' 213 TaxID=2014530 RepID=UPI00167DFF13|nr:hypothetical protein [Nostoc sp. 'Peltigera membranacea cyanobiont' 213]
MIKVIDRKDAINRRLYNNQSFVLTAIYRVSSLNRSVLRVAQPRHRPLPVSGKKRMDAMPTVGYANAFIDLAIAIAISEYAFAISGYAIAISEYAFAISEYAIAISEYAIAISGYAIAISGYAIAISGYAIAISEYAIAISGFAFIDFVITVADCTYSQTTNRYEK